MTTGIEFRASKPTGDLGGLNLVWSADVEYFTGAVAIWNSVIYQALQPNKNSEPPSANWSSIMAAGGGVPDLSAVTALTSTDQTTPMPNSRQLLAGTNVTFNDATPGQRTVSAASGGGGGVAVWDAGTTYATGDLVIDRGGTWQATGASTNSQPISGNTDWTPVGGTPYVDTIVTPPEIVSLPFYDPGQIGPGLVVLPAPGAGLLAVPVAMMSVVSGSDDDVGAWGDTVVLLFDYTDPYGSTPPYFSKTDGTAFAVALGSNFAPGNNTPRTAWVPFETHAQVSGATVPAIPIGNSVWTSLTDIINAPLIVWTSSDASSGGSQFGTRSFLLRVYYQLLPANSDFVSSTFYVVVGVNQGAKTISVTDSTGALNGATGTFDVTGSTGNDGTYTIVSAVAAIGTTVITTVEAIPDATADGWVEVA